MRALMAFSGGSAFGRGVGYSGSVLHCSWLVVTVHRMSYSAVMATTKRCSNSFAPLYEECMMMATNIPLMTEEPFVYVVIHSQNAPQKWADQPKASFPLRSHL